MNKGYVYLVGAGPGDPKLITVKGLECIQKADVIVYDRLASARLLTYARSDAEMIFAGKSPDRHALTQDEINMVLVEKAKEGKIVTRLKGGDPYVFGRGGEEAETLLEYGFKFEVIPGITAGIAVPAYAGIPVTHRDFTSTLGIITGNEDPTKEDSSIDWSKIATGIGTLVFYMGMANLPKIVAKLIENGRAADTPIALIRWGTRPEQETLTGTLNDIVAKVEAAKFKNPAIIIVGEVVTLRDKLKWFEDKPLFGQRVVVTRSRNQASDFARAIEDLGGEPWEFPTIDIGAPEDFGPLDAAIQQVETYDWIIITSVNGVHGFMQRMKALGKDVRDLKGIELFAVGPRTKEELEGFGLTCSYVPGEYSADAILDGLKGHEIKGKKILLPRADIARKVLPETLTELGAEVSDVVAYRTIMGDANSALLRQMFADNMIHVVTFTSSSTVKNFVEMLNVENYQELLKDVVVASIGPITTATAKEMGIRVDVEAAEYTIPGLTKAIVDHLANKK